MPHFLKDLCERFLNWLTKSESNQSTYQTQVPDRQTQPTRQTEADRIHQRARESKAPTWSEFPIIHCPISENIAHDEHD